MEIKNKNFSICWLESKNQFIALCLNNSGVCGYGDTPDLALNDLQALLDSNAENDAISSDFKKSINQLFEEHYELLKNLNVRKCDDLISRITNENKPDPIDDYTMKDEYDLKSLKEAPHIKKMLMAKKNSFKYIVNLDLGLDLYLKYKEEACKLNKNMDDFLIETLKKSDFEE